MRGGVVIAMIYGSCRLWGHLVDESENGTGDRKIKGQMGKLRQSIVTTVEWCNVMSSTGMCNYLFFRQ